ncbi:MAG: hypothetical protein E7469_03390 [Ruminococcaceae bacterium]|nr:hypothetical protein [Oscillospiraceae bacterium]
MAYAQVSYGSTGSAVSALQEKLNANGYSLTVDGVFGAATQKAVKDYQAKNGLTADGIVGNSTWSSLLNTTSSAAGGSTGKQVLSGVSDETSDRLFQLEQGYAPSDEVSAAQAERDSVAAIRPGDYQSSFEEELLRLYDELVSRPGFSYDPKEDAAYHSYAQLYERSGRQAMEDTLGKSAALTGGYGSTYAQTAAQQSYNGYLQQLAALLPQLEENARKRYETEGDAAQQRYELTAQQQKAEKAAWEQAYEAWQAQLKAAESAYDAAYDRDYNAYKTMLHYFADKAAQEQKASDGRKVNSGKVSDAAPKAQTLSSTAAESLQRAMGNYLSAGDAAAAQALAAKYAARMTAAQKRRFEALFEKYGAVMGTVNS